MRRPQRGRRLPVVALLVLLVLGALGVDLASRSNSTSAVVADSFVERQGGRLVLDDRPFRFAGTNMYWLALDDNVRDEDGEPTYPTRFRIDDAMETAQRMGGTVVRAWANSVGCARCIQPRLGVFDDEGFAALDYAVASAQRHDQRLILSLVDNWQWFHGSKHTYTDWRGLPESAFFSDPRVIADYLAFVDVVLTHVNPHTGLAYRDDPTIMAWSTGNEMWCQSCPDNSWDGSWTRQVAEHIDAVAPRQLVVDGHAVDPECRQDCIHLPSLTIPAVDLVDDHHYPLRIDRVESASATVSRYGKAYLVGEFDWNSVRGGGDALEPFLAAVRAGPTVGALAWVLIPHADAAGFADHGEAYGIFYPGRTDLERSRLAAVVAFAGTLPRATVPVRPPSPPAAPVVSGATATSGSVSLRWRGSAGAFGYVVQRRPASGEGWRTVAVDVPDQRVLRQEPVWTDRSLAECAAARRCEYRVAAVGPVSAQGAWSEPVSVSTR